MARSVVVDRVERWVPARRRAHTRAAWPGVLAVADDRGRLHAKVDLHGDLCAITTPQLRVHLDRLMDDGVADITVDLSGLRLCTSDALRW